MKFNIWHTNDVHSTFDAFAKAVTVLKNERNKETELTFDSGDFCDAKSVLVSGTEGTGGIELLKHAGYDAMSCGNNEFFMEQEPIEKMASMGLPFLACNLTKLDGTNFQGVKSHIILQKNGLRILVIGCAPYFDNPCFTDLAGLKTYPANERVQTIIQKENGNYDAVIVVSHLGKMKDEMLAQGVEGIDLILGGHSHTLYPSIEKVNNTWIHQSGKWCECIGKITVTCDENKHILNMEAKQIPTDQYPQNSEMAELIEKENKRGIAAFNRVLYTIDHDLNYDPYHHCEAVDALLEGMMKLYDADFACINHGILSTSIDQNVTKMNLLHVSPSPLNPTTVEWRGKQILDAYKASKDPNVTHADGKGSGFRGNCVGILSFSQNVQEKDGTLYLNDKPLDEEAVYTVLTSDYLQRGSGYPMLKQTIGEPVFHAGFFRDVLENTLQGRIVKY